MNVARALEIIKEIRRGGMARNELEITEAMDITIHAMERQIPKKVTVSQWNGIGGVLYKKCPACETLVYGSKFDKELNFCINCGQKLIWE